MPFHVRHYMYIASSSIYKTSSQGDSSPPTSLPSHHSDLMLALASTCPAKCSTFCPYEIMLYINAKCTQVSLTMSPHIWVPVIHIIYILIDDNTFAQKRSGSNLVTGSTHQARSGAKVVLVALLFPKNTISRKRDNLVWG